jgi:hypothetical protein
MYKFESNPALVQAKQILASTIGFTIEKLPPVMGSYAGDEEWRWHHAGFNMTSEDKFETAEDAWDGAAAEVSNEAQLYHNIEASIWNEMPLAEQLRLACVAYDVDQNPKSRMSM